MGAHATAAAAAVLLVATCVAAAAAAPLQQHEPGRISGDAVGVLDDDPVGKLKVFVYEMPRKYNRMLLDKDSRCLHHMFAAEIFMHQFLLSSAVRTLDPEEADWFYTPAYTTCDLTPQGFPLPFRAPRIMRSAIRYVATTWPFWNRTDGADHFFLTPHDFGACFHYQEERAMERGILPLLRRATLVQTFGQRTSSAPARRAPSSSTSGASSTTWATTPRAATTPGALARRCGRTSRTTRCSTSRRSTRRRTTRTCSAPSSACARWGGRPGAPGWWRRWCSGASPSSSPTTSCCRSRTPSPGRTSACSWRSGTCRASTPSSPPSRCPTSCGGSACWRGTPSSRRCCSTSPPGPGTPSTRCSTGWRGSCRTARACSCSPGRRRSTGTPDSRATSSPGSGLDSLYISSCSFVLFHLT
uniref:Exostosin GT47 domain-containing protein n=1 Tax=Zea mays TaxID=4577 RepID=A0A804N8B3_MAIZE